MTMTDVRCGAALAGVTHLLYYDTQCPDHVDTWRADVETCLFTLAPTPVPVRVHWLTLRPMT